ncbi:TPA: LacI family DNA-binding transcriptional regulator [Streptococcus equi subsp. zooepidemicus]|nr:LacI family DNA-binding transcriptional regulator [Streptococcus equi subsp. zooepidemicus]HEL0452852.1 LacI family DNA-binding transcriptional regulator [Streptococcus equi subsp. zooepidemicus]HEL1333728.1 LacI family DNA-binding transcriptional regulator [Streptococcus equi subsp. zooepidemicus]
MQRKVTINDIADLANTSKTTVSFYLNGRFDKMSQETKSRIKEAIEATNYKPSIAARSLNAKATKLIGVVIGDITNSFSNQIVKGIESKAQEFGYQIIIGNSNYDPSREDELIEKMLNLGVDGFIIQPTSNFRKYSRIIEVKKKHMVFFDSQLYEHRTNWVKTNNYDAVYDTIQQCINKGYQSFIMVTGNPNLLSTRIERASGFIDVLEANQLQYHQMIIDENQTSSQEIAQFLQDAFDQNRHNLVFVPNCWALPKVFTAMKALKVSLPETGLVGFDNIEWTRLSSPSITTIIQPAYEEGEQATSILIDDIEGHSKEAKQQIFDCQVNWQESTF